MQTYSCIIVEDEPIAAEVLQNYVNQIPFLDLKGICIDAIYAMEMLQKESIDLIFLDIHLPKLKGLDFVKTLKNPPSIIIKISRLTLLAIITAPMRKPILKV